MLQMGCVAFIIFSFASVLLISSHCFRTEGLGDSRVTRFRTGVRWLRESVSP